MKLLARLESSIEGSKSKVSASKSLKLNKFGAAARFPEPAGWGGRGAHLPLVLYYWCSSAALPLSCQAAAQQQEHSHMTRRAGGFL